MVRAFIGHRFVRRLLLVTAALVLAAGCSKQKNKTIDEMEEAGKAAGQPQAAQGEARKEAPNFTLKDINGDQFQLSQLKGKVVILDFWATWCPPCRQEIPHFVDLQKQYQSKGLEIVGISVDDRGAAVVKPFAQKFNINYTMLVDGQAITNLYGGVQGIPTTFVLDKQGRIVKKFVGLTDRSVFENLVQGLLKES